MFSPLFGGGVNWATIPVAIEDIERIEVVRGTNAVSYGSNAFLGVINIITVDPALTHGFSVSTNYGNQNVRDYGLRVGGKIGEVGDFRFTYRQENDDGLTNRADWVDSFFSRLFDARADFVLSDRDSLQVSFGQVEGVTQNGRIGSATKVGPFSVADNPIRDMRQTSAYAQMLWRRVLSPSSDLQLRYSYVNERSDDAFSVRFPPQLLALFPQLTYRVNQSGDEGQRNEIELQHSFQPGEAERLVWGASWREDGMRSAWALPGQGMVNREVSRLFGNLEWKPLQWFTGNAGLAGENDSLAGFHVLPRTSTNFHLNGENTIRLGYSRAYRTGSTVDYLGHEKISIPPVFSQTVFTGSLNLPAERLDTCEIGYLGDWRDWRSSLDVRLFSERIPDRLYRIDVGNGKSTVPIQDVQIRGLEYQFKWQPFEVTRVMLNQAFAKTNSDYLASALATSSPDFINPQRKQDITNFTEESMPHRSTSILLMQKLPWGLEFSTAGYWQGKMKWSTTTESQKYRRVDARLGYPFRAGGLGGEVAFVVQSLNGAHGEYKSSGNKPDDRIVDRREWVSLRLDY